MEIIKSFVIDLTQIKGRGDIDCPRCGSKISPDDETEKVYMILEAVMKIDCVERLVLQCNRCRSQIHLVGFDKLETAICDARGESL